MKILNREEVKKELSKIIYDFRIDGVSDNYTNAYISFNEFGEATAYDCSGDFKIKHFDCDCYRPAREMAEDNGIEYDEWIEDLDSDAEDEAEEILMKFEKNHCYCVCNKRGTVIEENFETYAEAQKYCDGLEYSNEYHVSVV